MLKKYINSLSSLNNTQWIIIDKDKIFWPQDDSILLAEFSLSEAEARRGIYLGEHNSKAIYCLNISQLADSSLASTDSWFTLRERIADFCPNEFDLASKALSFSQFYNTHRFCGRCGSKMRRVGWEVATHCDKCQHRCYPRLSPCIIVAIRKGDELLLAQAKRSTSGTYSVLAGFIEPGETAEQAVKREVYEEVGIQITNIRYFSSQSWPFPHNLMLGYLADYKSGNIFIDEKEIVDAKWFKLDQLPKVPGEYSIAGRLIKQAEREIVMKGR